MSTIISILGGAICLLALVCIYNLVNYIRYYGQFKTFNENIVNWSRELDTSMREAIQREAAILLMEMDQKVDAMKNEEGDSDAVDSPELEEDEFNNNNDNNLEENVRV